MMKISKKTLITTLMVGLILTGGIIAQNPTITKVSAVYDKELRYDPDAQPNIWGIHNLDDLWNEMKKLHWFSVCKTCLGGFNDEGTFGISPAEKLTGEKNGKWIVYKCFERNDYEVVAAYDDEGVACRVYIQCLQQRARMRLPIYDWSWYPDLSKVIQR